ncbi:sulfotransferase ssu-1-like [Haemaphysalis longicornis]
MKDRTRPFYRITNGHRIPGAFSEEVLEGFLKYRPASDDIFVVTFPKCGTHWTSVILSKTLEVCRGIPPRKFILAERGGVDAILAGPAPRIVCTHLPFHLTPHNVNTKYIYVARNPKDCCVSFFEHTKAFPSYGFQDGTFDEYLDIFLNGETDFGNYYETLKSWYAHKDDPNVLFLTYESIKLDTEGSVLKIAEFVNPELSTALRNDSKKMNAVLESSTVNTMRKNIEGPFVRKGVVGDWKNYFFREQSQRLEEKFLLEVKGTDIPDLWKDVDWKLEGRSDG